MIEDDPQVRVVPTRRFSDRVLVAVLGTVVGFTVLAPYLVSRYLYSDEPVSVSIMYRDPMGDSQYFPFVRALSNGNAGEFSIKEQSRKFPWSFPYIPLVIHAACFRLSATWGFALADVIVAIIYFVLLSAVLRTVGVEKFVAQIGAFVIATGHNLTMSIGSAGLPQLQLIADLWGHRFPRPYVTEVFVLGCMLAAVRLATKQRGASPAAWIVAATSLALAAQGDIHSAMTLSVVLACLAASHVLASVPNIGRSLILAAVTFMVVLSPFVVQRIWEHPDVPARYGVFHVARMRPLIDIRNLLGAVVPVACIATLGVALGKLRRGYDGHSTLTGNDCRRVLMVFAAIVIVGRTMMPVSMMILGKAVQLSHFKKRQAMFESYVLTFLLMMLASQALIAWHHRGSIVASSRRVLHLFVAALCGFVVVAAVRWNSNRWNVEHLRKDFAPELSGLGAKSYRKEFGALVRFLETRGASVEVISTWDPMVYSWWLTFRGGSSYLGEPFVSVVPDAEIESRLASFCSLIGMKPQDCVELIEDSLYRYFWLSCCKHQASTAFLYSTRDDYAPEDLLVIRRTSIYQNFNTKLPNSEVKRLRTLFQNTAASLDGIRGPDVIVMTNTIRERSFAPTGDQWLMSFSSSRFRVYERRVEPDATARGLDRSRVR